MSFFYMMSNSSWTALSQTSFSYFYSDIWRSYHDPRSGQWPFFHGGPWSTLAIVAAYLYFVKVLGPEIMKERQPMHLNKLIAVYNVIMVVLSVRMFMEANSLLNYGLDTWGCQIVNQTIYDDTEKRKLTLGWIFFVTKLVELSDTVFFILRKKYSHVSTLHVTHHSLVPVLVWIGFKFLPGGNNAFFVWINSFVHTIMYTYYALSTLGPKVTPYLWWKKYLTKLQIIQFILIIINNVRLLLMPNCPTPKSSIYMSIFNAGLFLSFFASFYRKAYLDSAQRRKVK